ncbi:hypothetical protein BCR35DRAFT_334400 [Leucosporidium creatinivorum]|uniref:Uncharacterized protein n=1 Tax=Leucosporidium creatinivorum TaxID=106004 RepID=A0A1Y2E913_9BASI|nr:hypothetical protein BCR35DRAFT_334400 [Leucosporidium creatinivorum]
MAAPAPTPCDIAWSHIQIDSVLPPLHADATAEQWSTAFTTRGELCKLLLSVDLPRFMAWPDVGQPQEVRALARRAVEQSREQHQRLTMRTGLPRLYEQDAYLNTFVGVARAMRPFCSMMDRQDVNRMLRSYVDSICNKMTSSAKTAEQGDQTTYLCARHWATLDPLRRAAGVLAAKAYYERIEFAAQLRLHPAVPPLFVRRAVIFTLK